MEDENGTNHTTVEAQCRHDGVSLYIVFVGVLVKLGISLLVEYLVLKGVGGRCSLLKPKRGQIQPQQSATTEAERQRDASIERKRKLEQVATPDEERERQESIDRERRIEQAAKNGDTLPCSDSIYIEQSIDECML